MPGVPGTLGVAEDLFRSESARVLGTLMRRFGNLDLAVIA